MKTLDRLIVLFVLSCALAPGIGNEAATAEVATWYVDGSVSASGDGKAWATAFKKIQKGIDGAFDGDTVMVREGTYVENIQFKGKNIILTGTDPLDSNVVANTVIDGNQKRSAVSFDGTETEACVLSGFTIRNGSGTQVEPSYVSLGGGIYGAVNGIDTHATIENNVISGNYAETGGGMAYCDGLIRNNSITHNGAFAMGGGGLLGCDGIIENNAIVDNSANGGGGLDGCGGTIRNNLISGNWGHWDGGGLAYCGGTIQNNVITANETTAEGHGGGVYACAGIIEGNLIVGNKAGMLGGGGLSDCDGVIRNNTICSNWLWQWDDRGGGLRGCNGTMTNCIIWGNEGFEEAAQLYESSLPMYSCIQDWTGGGERNIALDPKFIDADGSDNEPDTFEDNDYRLLVSSPCIDAGKNEDWMWTATDLDGNPRIWNGTVDMGAYEYRFILSMLQVAATPTGGIQLTWTSRPGDEYILWSCTDLASGASIQEQTVPSAGHSTSWTDPSPSGSRKFYKVELR